MSSTAPALGSPSHNRRPIRHVHLARGVHVDIRTAFAWITICATLALGHEPARWNLVFGKLGAPVYG